MHYPTGAEALEAYGAASDSTISRFIRIEVVELQRRRSRALDPHLHRHLWLNIKVLGADGTWSNLDSCVARKPHTVINTEGELAASTDLAWIAALARHGYTLDDSGEIAEFAGAVRPSGAARRRSRRIERACNSVQLAKRGFLDSSLSKGMFLKHFGSR